jgi:hypothetical protein
MQSGDFARALLYVIESNHSVTLIRRVKDLPTAVFVQYERERSLADVDSSDVRAGAKEPHRLFFRHQNIHSFLGFFFGCDGRGGTGCCTFISGLPRGMTPGCRERSGRTGTSTAATPFLVHRNPCRGSSC